MTMLPALTELLHYQNPLVIKRFKRNFPSLQDKAEGLFQDMLKYLWLCKKHDMDINTDKDNPELKFTCVMHREMTLIDEMWHTFILVTRDYADFCQTYFGEFMHHMPEVGGEAAEYLIPKDEFQAQLELFLSYVYDHLGEDTVRSWFAA